MSGTEKAYNSGRVLSDMVSGDAEPTLAHQKVAPKIPPLFIPFQPREELCTCVYAKSSALQDYYGTLARVELGDLQRLEQLLHSTVNLTKNRTHRLASQQPCSVHNWSPEWKRFITRKECDRVDNKKEYCTLGLTDNQMICVAVFLTDVRA